MQWQWYNPSILFIISQFCWRVCVCARVFVCTRTVLYSSSSVRAVSTITVKELSSSKAARVLKSPFWNHTPSLLPPAALLIPKHWQPVICPFSNLSFQKRYLCDNAAWNPGIGLCCSAVTPRGPHWRADRGLYLCTVSSVLAGGSSPKDPRASARPDRFWFLIVPDKLAWAFMWRVWQKLRFHFSGEVPRAEAGSVSGSPSGAAVELPEAEGRARACARLWRPCHRVLVPFLCL